MIVTWQPNWSQVVAVGGRITIRTLADVARLLGGALDGEDAPFHGVSTDSRTIKKGELFVALQGPNFDGGEYLEMARQRGAVGAIVQQRQSGLLSQIVVEDTLAALGTLAAAWRAQFELPVAAITGSNGKTTVKEMAASILRQLGPGTVTRGNLNNEIGVPLTLLRLSPEDRWAVIEMGASAEGEIAKLSEIAQPTVSLVNNIGSAHLGGFGSVEKIASAKGEIYAGLRADGVALINHDLPQALEWMERSSGERVETYGCSGTPTLLHADIRGQHPLKLTYRGDSIEVELPLPGEHNRLNAMAAAALSIQTGATLQQVRRGLESIQAVPGRLERKAGRGGSTIIDDTYNASPESMQRAIEVLSAHSGRKVLVLGDMGELGRDGPGLHRQVGLDARSAGIDRLYALGNRAAGYVAAFGEAGLHFSEIAPLLEALESELEEDSVILVKGSRFMKMERIVEKIREERRS